MLSRLAPPKSVEKGVRALVEYKKTFKKDRNAGVPDLLIDMALFPYQWGPAFTCAIYKERGWPAVNRMYAHPPTSSAQVFVPQAIPRAREATQDAAVVGLSLTEHKEFDGLLCSSMSTWYRAAFEEAKR